jgi:hypothetical protein
MKRRPPHSGVSSALPDKKDSLVNRVALSTCLALVFVAVVCAVGCGVQAKSERHAAGVCDSVKPLMKSKNSMDALDQKVQNLKPAITSLDVVRQLSKTYRGIVADYTDLEADAKAEVGKVDAGDNTQTIQRMWRQLTASLHQRIVGMTYFADVFAHPEQLRTKQAEFSARGKALNDRMNAQNARMESELNDDLSSLGFKREPDGFVIDC